jgi:hypothetical protein
MTATRSALQVKRRFDSSAVLDLAPDVSLIDAPAFHRLPDLVDTGRRYSFVNKMH